MLVTGATGGIGRRLVEQLTASGVPTKVLVREDPTTEFAALVVLQRGDLVGGAGLEEALAGVDVVFHLASYAPQSDEPAPEDNPLHSQVTVEGTARLLRMARQAGVKRLVFASSTRVIDGSASVYAAAKTEAERLIREERGAMEWVILRVAPVYGFADKGSIAQLVRAIDAGRLPPLPELGDRRSLVHVDDVLQALLLAAVHPAANGRIYTVTDFEVYSMRRIYLAIAAALGKPVRKGVPRWLLRSAARAGDLAGGLLRRRMPFDSRRYRQLVKSAWFDGGAIGSELGFHPGWRLETALPPLIEAYRQKVGAPRG